MEQDIRLALLTGVDLPLQSVPVAIHQPTIKEISLIGEKPLYSGVQCLSVDLSMIKNETAAQLPANFSNFNLFISIMLEKTVNEKKLVTTQLLSLLFPLHQIMFTPRSIFLQGKDNESSVTIDEKSFDELQLRVKDIFCLNNQKSQQMAFNPVNDKAKEIAEKILKGRQRVAAQRGDADASILGQYLSVLSVGLGLPISVLSNYTIFQLYDSFERYQLKLAWDLDLKQRLAGGKPNEQAENWMKNLH